MSTTRVWNVTNDPGTKVPPQNLMVLGKLLKPGQSLQVEEAELQNAHKTKKDVEAGLLAIGKAAPGYLAKGARASLPDGLARGHGEAAVVVVAKPVAAPVKAKVEEDKVEEPKVEESKKDESNKWAGKHKR